MAGGQPVRLVAVEVDVRRRERRVAEDQVRRALGHHHHRGVDVAVGEVGHHRGVHHPVMHHLALGIDPTELGGAPFALATDLALRLRAAEDLELGVHPGARAYVLPCIAGHVGADTAGVLLAEAPHERDDRSLIVDVGTNAAIVLGTPAWSDEPGYAGTTVTGICGSGIIEAVAELYLAGILTADGVLDGAAAARSPRVVADGRTFAYVLHDGAGGGGLRIAITQNDIRQVQLAKAALHAGCRLLMDRLGVDAVDRVRLAGAFGAHIDPVHALV